MTTYAIYRGDEFVFMGTADECAEEFKVKPQYIKRLITRKRLINGGRVGWSESKRECPLGNQAFAGLLHARKRTVYQTGSSCIPNFIVRSAESHVSGRSSG